MKKTDKAKVLLITSLPLMAAFLAQKGMQFIDTFMMGWIGADALAAGALGTSTFITTLLFCMGTLSAVGIMIAQAKGANKLDDISHNLLHGMYLAIFLSIPSMMLIWYMPHILLLVGEDKNIVQMTSSLLHGLVWGFPGFLLFLLFREFISAFALTRIVMMVALCSIPLTFSANYILIYGKYGFPPLGIAGIGYAGAVIMWFMFFCLFLYSKIHPTLKRYVTFHSFHLDLSKIHDMIHIGMPSGVLLLLEGGMFLAAAIMMGYFGENALAAHQIAVQSVSIAYTIPFALGMATALQVGHAMGANEVTQAKHISFIGLICGLILSAIIAIFFVFTPETIVKIYLRPDEFHFNHINQIAASYLLLSGIFQCFDAIQAIVLGILRGLKDTLVPMLLSIGCYWILGVGSAYYFSFHTRAGAMGIWYGLTFGICSIAIVLLFRLRYQFKQLSAT